MVSSGLLVLSNIKNIKLTLQKIQKTLKNLYIHVNVTTSSTNSTNIVGGSSTNLTSTSKSLEPPPSSSAEWCSVLIKIYKESFAINPALDVRILINPFKNKQHSGIKKNIEIFYSDEKLSNLNQIQDIYKIHDLKPVVLSDSSDDENVIEEPKSQSEMFNTVVLGGTFDRIHLGHKILLTEAVTHANNKLVVGVTDENMIRSKTLSELILPVETRIEDLRDFLYEIDSTLEYEIVPIHDPFGPTQSDPNMDMIVVSAETKRGGDKVNEVRVEKGLKPLKIHCIDLMEVERNDEHKETKISSSNTRMDLLGNLIKLPEARSNLKKNPYIVGLTGGIASGKSRLSQVFAELGAVTFDCDKIAHEIYEPDQICYKRIIESFGQDVVGSDRKINRTKLGSIVFSNKAELEKLNQIVWPELLIEVKKRIQKVIEENANVKVIIIEAAILFKAGWDKECHEVWSMIIPTEVAVKRIQNRNKLTEEEARKRVDNQMDNKIFVRNSNVIFSSQWSYEFTRSQAEKAWGTLLNDLSKNKRCLVF